MRKFLIAVLATLAMAVSALAVAAPAEAAPCSPQHDCYQE